MRKLVFAIFALALVSCSHFIDKEMSINKPVVAQKYQDLRETKYAMVMVSDVLADWIPMPNDDKRPKIKVMIIRPNGDVFKITSFYFVVSQTVYDRYEPGDVFLEFPIYFVSQIKMIRERF